ncbi:MAG: sigma-54 dependent transcriptional regulator, partial [Candidatus Nitrosotenuis sp.]
SWARGVSGVADVMIFLLDGVNMKENTKFIRQRKDGLHRGDTVNRFAPTKATILLVGETGVGKNLLARCIHDLSPRKGGRFVIMDGATMNDNLMESELFGHEKGAFTGAGATKIGRIEIANGGTLFLNEVQNLSLEMQTQLLEVVESGRFYRVGGQQEIQSNFRLIVATNQNLEQLVESGRFRKDFYYRVYRAIIEIPPLRERKEDILPLAEHYVQTYSRELGKTVHLSEAAKELLLAYPWHGNVRELMNAIHRAVIHCKSAELLPQDFELKMRREALVVTGKENGLNLEEVERRYIEIVLESVNGNNAQACKILKIDRSTLYRKIKNNGE